jgi:hypothetical protein
MTQPRWSDAADRQPPQRDRPGGYPRPEPGADHRGRALHRDDRAAYWKDRGADGDDRSRRGHKHRPPSATGRGPQRWGTLPGGTGVCIVVASAALGGLITAVTGSQPGRVLGVLLVGGTITAALVVRPRATYLVIPVPALAYVVAATLAGLVSDRATGTSGTALALNSAQWIASGFIAMTVATGLAILITLVRWYTSRRSQHDPTRPGGEPEGPGQHKHHPRHRPAAANEGAPEPQAPKGPPGQRHT